MDAPPSPPESKIDDLYRRRGQNYPTRSHSILNQQDRDDWIAIAGDIITKGGKKPGQVRRIATMSGTNMAEVIKSYAVIKPQRSLKDILIHIINSSRSERTAIPAVEEYRKLFEEMSPEPASPALISMGLAPKIVTPPAVIVPHASVKGMGKINAHVRGRVNTVLIEREDLQPGGCYDVAHFEQLTPTQKRVMRILGGYTSGPENSPASYKPDSSITVSDIARQLDKNNTNVYTLMWLIRGRIQSISELQESGGGDRDSSVTTTPISSEVVQRGKREKYTPDKLPNLAGMNDLYPYLQSTIFNWYGYDGKGDPTDSASYDVSRAKTSQEISDNNGIPINRVQTYLCIARKALGWLPEEATQSDVVVPQESLLELLVTQNEEETPLSVRSQRRRTPTPLPKRNDPILFTHTGETRQTPPSGQGARVILPPREIPKQHIHTPPAQVVTPRKQPTTPTRIYWKPRREAPPDIQPSFEDIIEQTPAGGRVFSKEETLPEPAPKKVLREMPEFTSYHEALEWGQQQENWMWSIALWKNSTIPMQQDNLGVLQWLGISKNPLLQEFLEKARGLSGQPRGKYVTVLSALFESLPEENIGLSEIQRNHDWMSTIQIFFVFHNARRYTEAEALRMQILSTERLKGAIADIMIEYETEDPMGILALIADTNWTPTDEKHYLIRGIGDVFVYQEGDNMALDRVFDAGTGVAKRMLEDTLRDISLQIPLGETQWPRYREYIATKTTLYDVVVSLVKKEGGNISSNKTLFYKLKEILGV